MPNLLHVHLPACDLRAERSWLCKFNVCASVSKGNCVHDSLNTCMKMGEKLYAMSYGLGSDSARHPPSYPSH